MFSNTPEAVIQTVYTHEAQSWTAGTNALPATGFAIDGADALVVKILLGVITGGGTLVVTVQHADDDGTGDPPEAGDFVDALDDDGNAIATATIVAAGDQLCYQMRVDAHRLKHWVRIESVGAVAAAVFGIVAEIHRVKYTENADENLSTAQLAANKVAEGASGGGYVVTVP